jgi:hypothetical protein
MGRKRIAQVIIKSTGDWETDKALLKETYGTGNIPARTIANMIGKEREFIYRLARSNQLGRCEGRNYNFLLQQLIAYVECTAIPKGLQRDHQSENGIRGNIGGETELYNGFYSLRTSKHRA